MAAAQMKKAELLEDQNMLLLMTMPDEKITTHEAREYLRLRRGDELRKLRKKLADEEERERLSTLGGHDEAGRSLRHQNAAGRGMGGAISRKPRGRRDSPNTMTAPRSSEQLGGVHQEMAMAGSEALPRCQRTKMATTGSAFRRPRQVGSLGSWLPKEGEVVQASGACRQMFSGSQGRIRAICLTATPSKLQASGHRQKMYIATPWE